MTASTSPVIAAPAALNEMYVKMFRNENFETSGTRR